MHINGVRPVGLTDPGPEGLVDVTVTDGVVTAVSPSVGGADNGWLMPGLWDQHVHLGQWSLSSARLDSAPARSSAQAVDLVRERLKEFPDWPVIGWGHRPTARDDAPVVSDLDAIGTDQPIVLICGDGHHGWLNTRALQMLALPTREGVVAEAEWFQGLRPPHDRARHRRHRPRRLPPHHGGRRGTGHRRPRRLRVQRRRRRVAGALARGRRPPAHPDGVVRRWAGRRPVPRPAEPATRSGRIRASRWARSRSSATAR
nr:amidohydrolase family protein [Nocardioides sp. B-3]